MSEPLLPATALSGFLGAGKTTLRKREGPRVAVIAVTIFTSAKQPATLQGVDLNLWDLLLTRRVKVSF